jgi:hypothetical protein
MSATTEFTLGGYEYIPSVFQYSAGVRALRGFQIERVRFHKPVSLDEGFRRVAAYIKARGRPLTAFNERYVVTLAEWGIFDGTRNPVARSNLCPPVEPPSEVSFHAFSFTDVAQDAAPSFINAGGAEARPGPEPYIQRTIRHGERSAEAMTEKARFVLAEMERRMGIFGFSWPDTTATQVYTIYDISPFLEKELVRRGAAHSGITLHYHRPPVRELDFEMDCRGVRLERVVG